MEPDKPGLTAEVELHKNPPSAHRHFPAGEDAYMQYMQYICIIYMQYIDLLSDTFYLNIEGARDASGAGDWKGARHKDWRHSCRRQVDFKLKRILR